MLKITRNNNLNGVIEIDGNAVVQLNASVTADKENPDAYSSSGVSRTVVNTELYRANMVAIRKEIAQFEDEVYLMEDEILTAAKVEIEE